MNAVHEVIQQIKLTTSIWSSMGTVSLRTSPSKGSTDVLTSARTGRARSAPSHRLVPVSGSTRRRSIGCATDGLPRIGLHSRCPIQDRSRRKPRDDGPRQRLFPIRPAFSMVLGFATPDRVAR